MGSGASSCIDVDVRTYRRVTGSTISTQRVHPISSLHLLGDHKSMEQMFHIDPGNASPDDKAWSTRSEWVAPTWYIHNAHLSKHEIEQLLKSYTHIGESSTFRHEQRLCVANKPPHPQNTTLTSRIFLSYHLYECLFMIVPSLRKRFHNDIEIQGDMVLKVFELLIQLTHSNTEESMNLLREKLKRIVLDHNEYGVTVNQYNILGDALFNALEHCIGPELWSLDIARLWKTLYSQMLDVIVPLCTQFHGPIQILVNSKSAHNSSREQCKCPFAEPAP